MDNKNIFNTNTLSGLIFSGCTMLGLGLGMVYGNAGGGVIIGIGVGMLAVGWMRLKKIREIRENEWTAQHQDPTIFLFQLSTFNFPVSAFLFP